MNDLYETKISNTLWIVYDLPGNAGWIIYFICVIRLLLKGLDLFVIISLLPAVLMLIGIIELISERIARLDRVLPGKRLFRGFGALTLGGLIGVIISVIGMITGNCSWLMLLGAVLCSVFAGLLYMGYKKCKPATDKKEN